MAHRDVRLPLQGKVCALAIPRAALEASLPWACTHPPASGRKRVDAIGLIALPCGWRRDCDSGVRRTCPFGWQRLPMGTCETASILRPEKGERVQAQGCDRFGRHPGFEAPCIAPP